MRGIELVVERGTSDRIDRYLSEARNVATRSQVQRLLRSGLVLVQGKPVKQSYRLKGGETVRVCLPEPEPSRLEAQPIPLDVIYEDGSLVVVNKPPGMVVNPGCGVRDGTIVNALLAHCRDLSGIGGTLRPGIVHRLDKGTSGLVIAAKDDRTHVALSEALKARKIVRTYEAIVWGVPGRKQGKIETLIGRSRADRKKMAVLRSSGRQAITTYRVVEDFGFASRLVINLGTGRTHQIRVHLSHIGHPVLGDPTYGGRRAKRQLVGLIDRQALHARRISFVHPVSGSHLTLECPLPQDMLMLLARLRQTAKTNGR